MVPKTKDDRRFGHKPAFDHPWKLQQQKTLSLKPVLA
jgi:hypothetical protein